MTGAVVAASASAILLEDFETSISTRWAAGSTGGVLTRAVADNGLAGPLVGTDSGYVDGGTWGGISQPGTRYQSAPPNGRSPVRGDVISMRARGLTAAGVCTCYLMVNATQSSDTNYYYPDTCYYMAFNSGSIYIGEMTSGTVSHLSSSAHGVDFTRTDLEFRFYVNPSAHPTAANQIAAKILNSTDGSVLYSGVSATVTAQYTGGLLAVGGVQPYKVNPTNYYVDNIKIVGTY